MVKFYMDEHICLIDSGKLPLYVKLIFWKQWATNFESTTHELCDAHIKLRLGIRTLVFKTNRKKIPVYLGIGKTEAEHILQKIQNECGKHRSKMAIV